MPVITVSILDSDKKMQLAELHPVGQWSAWKKNCRRFAAQVTPVLDNVTVFLFLLLESFEFTNNKSDLQIIKIKTTVQNYSGPRCQWKCLFIVPCVTFFPFIPSNHKAEYLVPTRRTPTNTNHSLGLNGQWERRVRSCCSPPSDPALLGRDASSVAGRTGCDWVGVVI